MMNEHVVGSPANGLTVIKSHFNICIGAICAFFESQQYFQKAQKKERYGLCDEDAYTQSVETSDDTQ
jgi:hypothetical protein